MSKRRWILLGTLLSVACGLWGVSPAAAQDVDETFQADLRALTANSHRLAGYEDGSLAAGRYVEKRLKEMGYTADPQAEGFARAALYEQTFPLVHHVATECELQVGEDVYTPAEGFYPCRPNLMMPSITPEGGITGRTLYVGRGTVPEYGNRIPKDDIVVCDLNSRKNWLNAFAMGARAVIFIGSQQPVANPYQHVNLPANLPRFYVTEELAEKLNLRGESQTLTIRAVAEWQQLRGRNVIGVVEGTEQPNEVVVLAAPLDSYGEVPLLSPGARDAANVAMLLKLAQRMKNNPPKRTTVLCFFDGQTLNHMGARQFYATAYRKAGDAKLSLDDLRQSLQREKEFVETVRLILSQPNIFDINTEKLSDEQANRVQEYEEKAMGLLQQEAKLRDGRVLDELNPLRNRIRKIDKRIPELQETGLEQGYSQEQIDTLVAKLQAEKDELRVQESRLHVIDLAWNTLERVIHEEANVHDPATIEDVFKHVRPDRKIWIRNDAGEVVEGTEFPADPQAGTPAETFRERLIRLTPQFYDELLETTIQLLERRLDEIEMLLQENAQGQALAKSFGDAGGGQAVLHLSINLGDAMPRWSFMHGDDAAALNTDQIGRYSRRTFRAMQRIHEELTAAGRLEHFDPRPIAGGLGDVRIYSPAPLVTSGAAARLVGVPNLSVVTLLDPLPRQGQPADTLEALNVGTFWAQGEEISRFIRQLSDAPKLRNELKTDARFANATFENQMAIGPSVRRPGGGSAMADFPGRYAVVNLLPVPSGGRFARGALEGFPPGFTWQITTMTDAAGTFSLPMVSRTTYNEPIAIAAKFSPRGLVTFVSNEETVRLRDTSLDKAALVLVQCHLKTLVGYGYNRQNLESLTMRSNSTSRFRIDRHLLCEHENVATIFGPVDSQGFKLFNKGGMVLLNNGPGAQRYEGQGISFGDPFEHPFSVLVTEHDLRVLNQYRLRVLRERRINQTSLEILMGKSEDLAEDALSAANIDRKAIENPTNRVTIQTVPLPDELSEGTTDKFCGSLAASTDYSRDVYVPLVGVMNDLVTAVVLLLLLSMPFAFALERLLIGTPHIYRQIGWFAFFFLLTFGILFLVNPAFKIATTPIIIFLAFAIILLSCLVIFIMIRKLQSELKKMQGLATTVHSADVSRLSTMMAAVNMGISTMRRRPLRTLLTAITVVLLTFTILTFASFGSQWGNRRTAEGPMSGTTPRIVVRHQLWNPVGEGVYNMLRGYLGEQAQIVPRYWVSPTSSQAATAQEEGTSFDFAVTDLQGNDVVAAQAAIGLDLRDFRTGEDGKVSRQTELAELFSGQLDLLEGDGLFLSETLANRFGLTDADIGTQKLLMAGREMTYAGTLSPQFSSYTMLEGSSVLPVDYSSDTSSQGTQQQSQEMIGDTDVAGATFTTYTYDSVVVIGTDVARDMGGEIRSLTIYPADTSTIDELSENISAVTRLPTYVGHRGGVERLIFTSLTRASGWKDLLVPVLLGGLIIFATLLGSVSDREREIYTFSSLGLAPPHVASLFFAEASVYAVVGGMGGYLLGQVVAVLLGWMSAKGWVSVPTMNYSSTNAIVTILIVMGTVLVSTIYPALKASRSANPGIQRAWKIPKPKDDLYDLVFPFTVSTYDITGVVSFLKEHFENFSDTSVGCFATNRCHIFRQADSDMLGFQADVALAPFDLGVNQRFALLSQPSDIEGIDEVRIMICRTSGTSGDWQRANRLFINDLRKQLLIWRSLPTEVMEQYRERTLEMWDDLPRENIEPEAFVANAKAAGSSAMSDEKEAI
jgi:hypothetical protein